MAHWALSFDKSISQECFTCSAVLLVDYLLKCSPFGMEILEDVMAYHCLLICSSSSKMIKVAIKPFVDSFVNGVVLVTNLLWGHVCLSCLSFSSCSILISTADVDGIVSCKSGITSIHVSRENTSNNVTKVRHIVDVWESASD